MAANGVAPKKPVLQRLNSIQERVQSAVQEHRNVIIDLLSRYLSISLIPCSITHYISHLFHDLEIASLRLSGFLSQIRQTGAYSSATASHCWWAQQPHRSGQGHRDQGQRIRIASTQLSGIPTRSWCCSRLALTDGFLIGLTWMIARNIGSDSAATLAWISGASKAWNLGVPTHQCGGADSGGALCFGVSGI